MNRFGLVRSIRSAMGVRVAWILLLAVVCCRAPQADAASSGPPDVIEGEASEPPADQTAEKGSEKNIRSRILPRISLLTPNPKDYDQEHTIISREPFDLWLVEALPNDVSAKSDELQAAKLLIIAISEIERGNLKAAKDHTTTAIECHASVRSVL
jgi:hypothetical protein